ncbi:hypothetical protein CMI48_01900 [Candidatus Pacearchaeota archaeon]|nr:hypothetical protein [Candidatus Pacearchaeota archaeon]
MDVEFTRLSSKGQVVIPRKIRESLHWEVGTPFRVMKEGDAVMIEKIELGRKSWDEVAAPFRKAAEEAEFTQEDLSQLIRDVRRKK